MKHLLPLLMSGDFRGMIEKLSSVDLQFDGFYNGVFNLFAYLFHGFSPLLIIDKITLKF